MMDAGVLEDEVVSMVDVLHEDNELEEEARAVLGDSDDQHCTFPAVRPSYFLYVNLTDLSCDKLC